MAYRTPLRTHEIRQIAVRAECDERTVIRSLVGMPCMPMTLRRIERALRELGYPRPPASDVDGNGGGEAA